MSAYAATPRRLRVDWTRCDRHGLCAALVPHRIALDEWGYPIVADTLIDASGEHDVRRAVAACPSLALRLTAT